ncbi:zinc transporter ZIP3 [Lingula anatina]|uniref:Zinc transporter ZIP3 n=1 Tax=Lingula anatina TaxID=7574 RepID=A0A1S3J436_LINAN|nr:zinc transporter ZIP3 [Lingula anatina]XP_013405037.1 zinc transporter ZIP3 [Lingula anatina]|eukprot:XP_013405036.1 zinc transporter ZIP3 [Lingula anatina]
MATNSTMTGSGNTNTFDSTLLGVKIGCLVCIFIITIGCCLVPLKIIPRHSQIGVSPKSKLIMSLCNCLSAGVFLGTCFNAFIPHVREKFDGIFSNARWHHDSSSATEFTVIMGFFLILTLEKLIMMCQKKPMTHSHGHEMTALNLDLPEEELDGYTASEESSAESVDWENSNESQKLCKPKRHSHTKSRKFVSHPQVNHLHNSHMSHDHHSHAGHSHHVEISDQESIIGCISLLLALSVHGLFEGMALALQQSIDKLISLFIAIISHESLCALAMGITLAKQDLQSWTIVKLAVALAAVIPAGMGIGMALGQIHGQVGLTISAILQGIAAGTFINVIFLEMLPVEIHSNQYPMVKVLFVFLGYIIMAGLSFAHT